MAFYRTGRKLGRTLYRDDQLIGVMDNAEDARWIAQLLNRAEREMRPVPRDTEDHEAWLKRDQAANPATAGDSDAVAGG